MARPTRHSKVAKWANTSLVVAVAWCIWSGVPSFAQLRVALTREAGQNEKLRDLLEKRLGDRQPQLVELPCIEHGRGPDFSQLEIVLKSLAMGEQLVDSIVLTSPEAARVFLRAWDGYAKDASHEFPVPLVTVGKGTTAVVLKAGLGVSFEPSKANAETLAAELPTEFGPRVLYPASAQAQQTLQEGLQSRGFTVQRLNTYTTQAVQSFDAAERKQMEETDVVTFGSPSAVKAWSEHSTKKPAAACIGGTSKKAAEAAGFGRVFAPQKPGLEGWADAVEQAIAAGDTE
eukprot:TRINITY_DN120936_c0_g1_i1.p1 TRINITY_DN120936_c0_g1~~TRINITY_DN120936_c0_g1_i1.p1  ORF type:complete len:309 (+),score=38.92 TRINITY_DN120936_c0_g1_i1:64-927(+)